MKENRWGRYVKVVPILCLVVLYVAGLLRDERKMKRVVLDRYPVLERIEPVLTEPLTYKIEGSDDKKASYMVFSTGLGWGGPFVFMVEIRVDRKISNFELLDHSETPSYILKLEKYHFFDQFVNQPANAAMILGTDVDAVTGATVSSTGFTNAIRKASHQVSTTLLGVEGIQHDRTIPFGMKELVILILFVMTWIGSLLRWSKLRYVTLLGGLVFLGFAYNFPFSISHFTSIFLGYIPALATNFTWWLVVGGALLFIIVSGKNLYCAWICPFGAMQEVISMISGFKLPVHPWIKKHSSTILYGLTFVSVGTMLYFRNTSSGNYEPFAALFKLDGYGFIWFILPLMLFSSFFWKRFYCRYFCPAGAVLTLSNRLRNFIKGKTKSTFKCKSVCHKKR
ncbi:4Fe-4S binding protein [Halosquirtibacter xylanolyticus]|uniref:4Fe-4S binding protein n=1 Tax=Halosquirtibacter xylanolyticus TaxID=3374599 RepID=UPI0037488821|nr:4Fe-4S binding protein [Prolixibacteraceae bacterium]